MSSEILRESMPLPLPTDEVEGVHVPARPALAGQERETVSANGPSPATPIIEVKWNAPLVVKIGQYYIHTRTFQDYFICLYNKYVFLNRKSFRKSRIDRCRVLGGGGG
jgi:hypothetical protein